MRQNLPWPIAVDCSVFPASGTACGSCWGSVLWVRCRAGARQCRLHAMLGGLWGDLSGSLCHSTAPWALLQVLEEKPSGLLVASLQAKDPDEGENGTIIYSLIGTSSRTGKSVLLCLAAITQADGCPLPGIPTPHSPSFAPSPALPPPRFSQQCSPLSAGAWAERFTLHVATGELRTATVLRRTERAEYIFTVTASDRGAVPRSTSAIIRVQVPKFLLSLHTSSSCPSAPAPFIPVPQLLLFLHLSSSCLCTIYPSLASWKTPSRYFAAFLPTSTSSIAFIPALLSC